jgi:hypothetical protein
LIAFAFSSDASGFRPIRAAENKTKETPKNAPFWAAAIG